MRTTHVLATLACLTPLAQDDEPSLEQEVAALIERTNALESFRLVYDVESARDGETEEGTVEILYRAPDFGRVHVSLPSKEIDWWLVGDAVHVYVSGLGWKAAQLVDPPIVAVLDEHFPSAVGEGSRGLMLSAGIRLKPDGELDLDFRMGRALGRRKHLLGWLGALGAASGVSRAEDSLSWEEKGVSRRVSRRTGMLEELAFESPETHLLMHLRSAELDVELPRERLVPPREAQEQPVDPEFGREFQPPPSYVRQLAFARADQWLTRTANDLDERACTHWRAVIDALHRPLVEAGHSRIDADVGKKLAQAAERWREKRMSDPSSERLATLKEELGESRAGLASSLAKSLEKELEALGPFDSVSHSGLHELEHEVYSALWDELVTAPILARHDEELAAALER